MIDPSRTVDVMIAHASTNSRQCEATNEYVTTHFDAFPFAPVSNETALSIPNPSFT